jgi:hypothetical protein
MTSATHLIKLVGIGATDNPFEIIDSFNSGTVQIQISKTKSRKWFYVNKRTAYRTKTLKYTDLELARQAFAKEVEKSSERDREKPSAVVYRPSDGIHFILTEEKTVAVTNPDTPLQQAFLIKHDHRNYIKQLMDLREMIRANQVKTAAELVAYCNPHPGKNSQMYGLELIPTKLERYI